MARRITAGVAILIVLAGAGFVAVHIPRTISIFLVAAFIAFGAAPLVQRLERWMPRGAAIALVYVGLVGALVLLALVIVPITYAQIIVLVGHTSDYVIASQDGVSHLESFVRARLGDRVALPTFGQMQAEVGERVGAMFALTLASIGTILLGTVNALLVGVSALILSVFLLSRGRAVRGGVLALLPVSRRAKTNALLVEVASIFGHFVAGQLALVRDRRRGGVGGARALAFRVLAAGRRRLRARVRGAVLRHDRRAVHRGGAGDSAGHRRWLST